MTSSNVAAHERRLNACETQPHLAILFTNHVAANMRRYWYALFPEDYGKQCYGPEWTHKYRGEILASLDILDPYLARLMAYSRESRSVLVVTSSMGQRAKDDLPENRSASQPWLPPRARWEVHRRGARFGAGLSYRECYGSGVYAQV